MIINGFWNVFVSDVFCCPQQLPVKHIRFVLGNQGVDFLGGLVIEKIAALQGQTFDKRTHEAQKDLQLCHLDETDGLAIGLQSAKSILFVDVRVVVEGTKDDFVAFGELFYLVESPQLVAFFKRIGYAGQKDKDFHLL